MLLSAVSVLVVAQSSSEIPEGLMNNPVLTSTKIEVRAQSIHHVDYVAKYSLK
jgi:hypothetical protein